MPTITNPNKAHNESNPSLGNCRYKVHSNHATVAYNGNAINCLKVSIHAPGLGSERIIWGKAESKRYGPDNPNATKVKTTRDFVALKSMLKAAPTAAPKKGAMHGVATTTAKAPEKNVPVKPVLLDRSDPAPVMLRPISNTPLRLKPRSNKSMAME